MQIRNDQLNRRKFLKSSTQAATGAVSAGIAYAAAPEEKKSEPAETIPIRALGKTGLKLPILGFGGAALPTAWLNLLAGRSAYDTWAQPLVTAVSTWYLAHPILAVAAGSWLSLFPVSIGYWVWTIVSPGLLCLAARELAGLAGDGAPARRWVYALFLSFPKRRQE